NRLAGELLGDVARWRERLLLVTDGPFDEVVVELNAYLTQVVAHGRVVGHCDEATVTVDVDVIHTRARQLFCLALATDRTTAVPGERNVRTDDAAVLQPLASGRITTGVDKATHLAQLADCLIVDTAAFGKERPVRGVLVERRRCRPGVVGARRVVVGAAGEQRNHGRHADREYGQSARHGMQDSGSAGPGRDPGVDQRF